VCNLMTNDESNTTVVEVLGIASLIKRGLKYGGKDNYKTTSRILITT
jgi:hypothetical protein